MDNVQEFIIRIGHDSDESDLQLSSDGSSEDDDDLECQPLSIGPSLSV
ncbi:unnamed protein product [Acanthoscelides obtectus]|uniref:Uncharacterized protein n=1 Tax=Acanthoscelides obtectus TaxID=200917 RepID=A0A9P0MBA5_ACAOB|nr:unnamed protein product [Acanthoscelides obtectus]CAK1641726.1 hypothetical protein AOBTE_LOCUS12590 [Acanthoscelides obtectus]